MKNFDKTQTGMLTCALNQLSLEKYIEDFFIYNDFAQIEFDNYKIRIISLFEGSLQFSLFDNKDNIIKTVMTDSAKESLPIKRLILSLLGLIMMQAFDIEWDGYTLQEGSFVG